MPTGLECDVSVEDDNRQEWVFTLYDFDNSGKVTKEVQREELRRVSLIPFYEPCRNPVWHNECTRIQ